MTLLRNFDSTSITQSRIRLHPDNHSTERTLPVLIKSVQETSARKGSILRFFEENWHYLVIAVLSIVTFALLYGVAIIDPTYTDWLLGKGDLSQHYIGWQAFKNSS